MVKHTNYHCGHAGCEYCHNARDLELKFWRRRYEQQPRLIDRARADLVEGLTSAGCTSWLVFREVDSKTKSSLLRALRRPNQSRKYGLIDLADGSLGFAVEPGKENFIRERIGRQEDARGVVEVDGMGALLDCAPIHQIGGNVRLVAIERNPPKRIATERTPACLRPSTFVHDLSYVPANTPEEHAKLGLDYPDTLRTAAQSTSTIGGVHTRSTVDDGASTVVPLKEETPVMSDRHLELLEKIARNTDRILELEEKRERLTQVEREELRDLLNPRSKWKN